MNLLLYHESKRALGRQGQTKRAGFSAQLWPSQDLLSLPDSLFDDVGHLGATAVESAGEADEEAIAGLLRFFAAPAMLS